MDKTKTYIIAVVGAFLAFIGLFFTWISVSVTMFGYSEKVTASGFQLLGSFGEEFKGFIVGMVVLLIILLALAIIGYSFWKLMNRVPSQQDALYLMIAGGVILLSTILVSILVRTGLGEYAELAEYFDIKLRSGFGPWLTSIGGIVVLGAGVFARLGAPSQTHYGGGTSQWQGPQQAWQQPQQAWQQPQQPPQQPWQQPQQPPQQPPQQQWRPLQQDPQQQWQEPPQTPDQPQQPWQPPQ